MKETSAHPSIEELAAFVRGDLGEAKRIAVEQHIQDCESCCEAMETVPDDTWIGRMRQAETAFEGTQFGSAQDLSRVFDEHSRYRLVKKLGEGGMGVVYLAEHRLMERLVALKVIRGELMSNSAAVGRFRQEFKSAAKLSHRGIVTAFDAEEASGLHFLVMEYVEGTTLDEVVARRGRLPVMHACNYIRQAATALQHAHEHAMVHRDVKPHNLMLSKRPSGVVKILDFGLTRIGNASEAEASTTGVESSSGLTVAGTTIGTPDYMAPEQVQDSRRADIRSDIYSLGCTLYFLLSGRPPFPDGTLAEKLSDQIGREPTPLNQLRDDIPDEVIAIVGKMMEKNPARRFQTPAEVAAALKPYAKPAKQSPLPALPPVVDSVGDVDLADIDIPAFDVPAIDSFASDPKVKPRASRRRFATPRRLWTVGLCIALLAGLLGIAALLNTQGDIRLLYVVPPQNLSYDDYGPVREALENSGIIVKVVSSQLDVSSARGPTLRADYLLDEVNPEEFDAIVFAGGGVWELSEGRHAEHVREIVQTMTNDDKPVAAIAVGQKVLAKGGFLQGRRAAYLLDVEMYAPESGAVWVREPVVVSDMLITASDPKYADRFANALIEALGGNP